MCIFMLFLHLILLVHFADNTFTFTLKVPAPSLTGIQPAVVRGLRYIFQPSDTMFFLLPKTTVKLLE